MEIRWLQAFIAVAEELHFGRAAQRLRMAQSPLSQTILKLERDVGTSLFDRNTRSVQLTAAGRAFLPHAHAVLEAADAARRATRATEGTIHGRLRIGFTGVLNNRSLPPLTRALRHRYPAVDLTLVARVMTRDALEQIDTGALDLAFVGLPVSSTSIRTRLIRREPFGAVLPSDHRLASESSVDLTDLADDGFITTPISAGSSLQEIAMRACLDAGFRPRIVQEITDQYMILMLVAAGVGVALMSDCVAAISPPGTVFVPLAGDSIYMPQALAWSDSAHSPAMTAALTVAEEILPTPAD